MTWRSDNPKVGQVHVPRVVSRKVVVVCCHLKVMMGLGAIFEFEKLPGPVCGPDQDNKVKFGLGKASSKMNGLFVNETIEYQALDRVHIKECGTDQVFILWYGLRHAKDNKIGFFG